MMRDVRTPTLVVTGAWNPAIFQPGWILPNLFNVAAGTTVPLTQVVVTQNDQQAIITYYLDIGIAVSFQRLEIYINSDALEVADRAEKLCLSVLEKLPHTPVAALGVNFAFFDQEPEPEVFELLKTSEQLEGAYKIKAEQRVTVIEDAPRVDLNLSRIVDGSAMRIEFNYHLGLSVEEIKAQLSGAIPRYLSKCHDLLQRIYGVEPKGCEAHKFPPASKGG